MREKYDGIGKKKKKTVTWLVFTNLLNVKLALFPDIHLFSLEYVLGLILPSQHKLKLVQLPKNKKRIQRNLTDELQFEFSLLLSNSWLVSMNDKTRMSLRYQKFFLYGK